MIQPPPPPRTTPPGSRPDAPAAPTMTNGATVHGRGGVPGLRHPREMVLVCVCTGLTVLTYGAWLCVLVRIAATSSVSASSVYALLTGGLVGRLLLLLPAMPFVIWVGRALLYAEMRASGVRMSPTQFPEGYRMVVEAAAAFGMRRVPDAYVILGNGTVNAFAAGHGLRRYVAVHSDLFEVGGAARDPEALRFVIGHEVGHLAAGHVSFTRLICTRLAGQIPLIGPALSRAQEYTADNHGFALAPRGAAGVIGLLSGGKYLGAQVNLHAMADRAARERGLWLHLAVWAASHPVHTWRAHALRDRSAPGRLMIRPAESTAWFPPVQPTGRQRSGEWPTPDQVLAVLDSAGPRTRVEEQFGRYPGVDYDQPRDVWRLADPTPAAGSRSGSDGPDAPGRPAAPGDGGLSDPGEPGAPGEPDGPGPGGRPAPQNL